jgi:hypothetical protein
MSPATEESYVNILNKASQMEFAKHDDQVKDQNENPEEMTEDMKLNKVDDDDVNAQLEGIEGNSEFEQFKPIINDMGEEGAGRIH